MRVSQLYLRSPFLILIDIALSPPVSGITPRSGRVFVDIPSPPKRPRIAKTPAVPRINESPLPEYPSPTGTPFDPPPAADGPRAVDGPKQFAANSAQASFRSQYHQFNMLLDELRTAEGIVANLEGLRNKAELQRWRLYGACRAGAWNLRNTSQQDPYGLPLQSLEAFEDFDDDAWRVDYDKLRRNAIPDSWPKEFLTRDVGYTEHGPPYVTGVLSSAARNVRLDVDRAEFLKVCAHLKAFGLNTEIIPLPGAPESEDKGKGKAREVVDGMDTTPGPQFDETLREDGVDLPANKEAGEIDPPAAVTAATVSTTAPLTAGPSAENAVAGPSSVNATAGPSAVSPESAQFDETEEPRAGGESEKEDEEVDELVE
jgi:hypothetical protein